MGLERKSEAGVAQLARASAFQAEGRGFESRLPLFRKEEELFKDELL